VLRTSLTASCLVFALGIAQASATPYWVAWEGDDYPEDRGWERIHYGDDGPAANRSLHDGVMTIDGLASIEIIDSYVIERALSPTPGEMFIAQWRLRVDEVLANPIDPFDPGLAIYGDDGSGFDMHIGRDRFNLPYEHRTIFFQPGVFHEWELRSADMSTYALYMDGALQHSGLFAGPGAGGSQVYWGDFIAGAASLSDWDYFRFGVVPEPNSGSLLLALLFWGRATSKRRIL
jgi:hypothetical protein